jgi:hypothetical protein
MPVSLPIKSQKMNSSQPELNDNWTKVSYKRGRLTQEGTEREAKHAKRSEHWFNQASTCNRYTALLEEESEDQQQKAGPENTPQPSPIYTADVTNISPLLQLLEQIAIQQYEAKALAHNLVKFQPKTSESYRIIIKALAEKRMQFHAYKLNENKLQSSVKNIHYSINPEEIRTKIRKLGHTVTNIWNIKQYRTKLPLFMFFVQLKPAPNNKDIINAEYIQQCKVKFEPPKHKRDIVQCANCQR